MNNSTFTFIDLFSGIGGFRIACESLGGKCVGFSEIDKQAISVYKDNFDTKDELEIGDITKAEEKPYADILLGGVPCQSWSIAGRMKGFDDPRGKLWLDTIKFTEQSKPKGFVYENVKGLADPRNKANLDLILSEFNKLGYNLYYQVLNAFDFGLPQSRERVFVVGIRKDIDKHTFSFPEKHKSLPFLADILDGGIKKNQSVANELAYKNSFNIAAVANKGNFYIFSDVRNGDHTIHSWDLIQTSQKEKKICVAILKNRRKPLYGNQDGNPMSYKDIANLFSNQLFDDATSQDGTIQESDLETLVEKKILRKVGEKYEFLNSKISSGINGVYRIFLPESHVFSTLTKSGSRDFISEISIPLNITDKKKFLVEEIYLKKKYRQITVKEASRLQGFPDSYVFSTKYSTSMGLLGNAVAVDVVKLVVNNLLNSIR